MKNSHFYNKLNDEQQVNTYVNRILSEDIANVKHLIGNIMLEAEEHHNFVHLLVAYNHRKKYDKKK